MIKILISPYSQTLRNGKENPKNYPWWPDLVKLLKEHRYYVTQIGASKDKPIEGVDSFLQNKSMLEIRDLIKEHHTWISVDSFIQHLNHFYDRKRGVVIWGQSNPTIFGYKYNENCLKSVDYLRKDQFHIWEQAEYKREAFLCPAEILFSVLSIVQCCNTTS